VLASQVALASHDILVCGEIFQRHRTASVQTIGAYANLGAESKFAAVIKAGGGIPKYRGRINVTKKGLSYRLVLGNNRIGVVGSVGLDMFHCFFQRIDYPNRQDQVQILGAPILFGRQSDGRSHNSTCSFIAA